MKGILPKYASYQIDGSGRDTYISFNNGGTLKTILSYKPENLNQRITRNTRSVDARTKMIHYHSNGSGRDSYIFDFDGQNHSFIKGLRDYSKTYETPKKFRIKVRHFHYNR